MKLFATLLLGYLLLSAAVEIHGQETDQTMPDKARQELSFMVGKWKAQFHEQDKEIGEAIHVRQWTEGKECLLMQSSGKFNGASSTATGISGWNAKAQAIVEHWYLSDGRYMNIRYPLAKMTDKEWVGSSRVVYADGRVTQGPVKLEKNGNDAWTFTASWEQDGQEYSIRNTTQKIKEAP